MPEGNPYILKQEDRIVITPEGHALLSGVLTDSAGPVYAFTDKASPLLAAAAMARLSRRGSDLREIYLDEFAIFGEERAEDLLDRVVTAYGDDSVQQLMPVALVVEEASNILTKRLEWSRLLSYLEQSTRYIYYDKKNAAGEYRYFVPDHLPDAARREYRAAMDAIFALYAKIAHGITDHVRRKMPEPADKMERTAWLGATRAQACDAARPVLPAATTSTVGIVGSAQAMENCILRLASDPLPECRVASARMLKEARKVAGPFLKRADMPERGGAFVSYRMDTRDAMRAIRKARLPKNVRRAPEPLVTLVDYWPKDEWELIPEMLFEESEHSVAELAAMTKGWDKETKRAVFDAYIGDRLNRRHKPGRAIEKAHYEWEIVGDYGTFRDLQRHRMVDMWEWQHLTPEYGYDVPALVEEAGHTSEFDECFRRAEALYKILFAAGFTEEAQYATLLGHRMRYRFMINAREAFHIHELRTGPQGHPGYRKIVQEMHHQLTRVHPLLGGAMRFVNMGEDPELTRLAAERATQKKLALLEKKTKEA